MVMTTLRYILKRSKTTGEILLYSIIGEKDGTLYHVQCRNTERFIPMARLTNLFNCSFAPSALAGNLEHASVILYCEQACIESRITSYIPVCGITADQHARSKF